MKKHYPLILIATISILLVSCSQKDESPIISYIQSTDGTVNDIDIKIEKIEEIKKITVADSLTFYAHEIERQKNLADEKIKLLEILLQRYNDGLIKEYNDPTRIAYYNRKIAQKTNEINNYEKEKSSWVNPYESMQPDEVLALLVKCTYKKTFASNGKTIEYTEYFRLSRDKMKCYGRTSI
ncbi:hypothetical protein [Dysgonomonas sp. ZJ279]|uniref:hypothetical protein n=1 Tax=Dysgonomonas sp. ZJ279 TaxID=2709796 RepID=UPI0013EB86B8|nr:hypothetical protein [Dysgonomonas sp. ZJ279]